jgi:biopolymer transport protein ExbB
MRSIIIIILAATVALIALGRAGPVWGQEDAGKAPVDGLEVKAESDEAVQGMGFIDVIRQSGIMGIILWLALLAVSVAGLWLAIDSVLQIQQKKVVPQILVDKVREAMEQGDVMKALEHCEEEPGPMANILSSGFSNVEEGFEVVQDVVAVSADLESEKLLQRVSYLNLIGNLAPMLGLLGTVQGMIFAFKNLALGSGAAATGVLALNISQALFTTAAGLSIAVPAVGLYYFFRNRATNIILGMEGLTLDLIKVLRNVEIVEEDGA